MPTPETRNIEGMATLSPSVIGINMAAFLDTLAHAEGTSTNPLTKNDGYDVIVSSVNGPKVFLSYVTHPFCTVPKPPLQILNHATPPLESDAAGRYQLMAKWWPAYRKELGLGDFGPRSQDRIAFQQINECKAIPAIQAGQIEQAILMCSSRWASLPGSKAGQPGGKSMDELVSFWRGRVAWYQAQPKAA